jgi:hypothetical protein
MISGVCGVWYNFLLWSLAWFYTKHAKIFELQT